MSLLFLNRSRVLSALRIVFVAGALFAGWTGAAEAALTGTLNIPGDYTTLADAITDLNTQGVGAGGVTLNLVAGNPQTAPAGGYVIGGTGSLVLTTTNASDQVTIQGNGNTITAPTPQTAGVLTDAIFKLIGADWITITGFTMAENAANTTTTPASNNMTEWGVALLHVSTTDGAQNNTVLGNTISLNRTYTNTWGVYANNRHSATAVTVTEDVTNNTTGPNNGNKVYGNTISNVNMGVAFIGTSAAANQDAGNDVGGGSAATGNAISNWGGAAAASSYVSNSGTSYCIFMNHQTGDNTSYNTLTSAAVSGTSVTFRGIFKEYTATAPIGTFTSNITNNTVTMTSGFTSGTFEAIRSQGMTALSTATININANTVLNCAVTGAASSSAMICIVNSSVPGTLSMSNNVIRGNTSTATTGGFTGVSNAGAVVNTINLNNNQVGNASGGAITFSAATSGAVLGVSNTGGAATAAVSLTGNDVRGITHSVAGTSAHTYVINSAATLSQNISSNTFTNLTVATTGTVIFIGNNVTAQPGGTKTVNSNSIVTGYSKTGAGGTVTLYSDNASSGATVVVNNNSNNFSNIAVTGATTIAGWSNTDGGTPTKTIQNNTFSNWTGGTSAVTVMNINFGPSTVTSNTISGITGGGAITGLVLGSSLAPANVSQNTISGLASTGASAVQGITTASTTSNLVKNKIYDLSGSNATSTVNGLLISAGTTVTATNNLIGDLRATAATATGDVVRGINITSTTSSSAVNLYDNTIYLNASSSGANFSTTGVFHTTNATVTTAALTLRGNIITNLSTPNGTGLTVAYRRSTSTLTNYTSASNNNLLYAGTPGANRLIFYDGTNSNQTLAAFQALVTPREANSVTENPSFLSTAGSNPNFLHIDPSIATQIESGGQPIAGVTDDYDGQTRNVSTPDIGADEGNFPLADFAPPVIAYTPLGNTSSTSSRSFTNVTVTDASGVNGTAGTRPRVYYKRGSDANNTFNDNTNGTAGWKYAEASGGSSPFDFTIDYSLLFGGPPVIGDAIQYFVVAQDLAGTPNVGINSGTFATTPSSVALVAANFPIGGTIRSYTIVDVPLSGDYTVGLALFNRVTGLNLTFEQRVQKVMREVLEPEQARPQMSGDKASTEVFLADQITWKKVVREVEEVTWVPMAGGQEYKGPLYVKRTENADLPAEARTGVYTTITAAVADLNARGVSGPVRFLLTDATYPSETFPITANVTSENLPTATNTVTIKPATGVTTSVSGASASNAIFKVFNTNYITIDGSNAVSGTTRDLTIENTSITTPSVVWFGSSGTTPITNGSLKNCVVRNGVNTSSAVVISDGATAGNAGYFSSMEVRNNKVEKAFIGVYASGGTTPPNGAGLTYASNELNTVGANAIRLAGLYMQGVNGATVSGNTVSDFEAVTGENDIGIWLASGTINATVSDNSVSNLSYTGTSSFAPIGIDITPGVASSNINVTHNTVTNISTSGGTAVRGIASPVTGSADIVIQRNTVQGVTNNSASTFGAYGIDVNAGNNHTIKNNFVSDVRFNMTGGAAFSTTFGVFGIRIGAGAGHVVDDNSVNLFGSMLGTSASSLLSAALGVVGTTSTGCDIRNNILSNTVTGGTTSIAHVSAYLPSGGTSAMNLTWNNNAYFSGTDATTQGIAQAGTSAGTGFYLASNFNPGATTPSTNLRFYTSTLSVAGTNDNASQASTASAPFQSATNLHLQAATPTSLESGGVIVAGINDDLDGDIRFGSPGYAGSGTAPDIGADEGNFTPPLTTDARALAFINPTNGGSKATGVAFNPQASFENLGTAGLTNVLVRFRIAGPSPDTTTIYSDTTRIASLPPATSQTVTFASFTIAAAGTYTMNARVFQPGDTNPANDQITGSFQTLSPLAGTYNVGTAQSAPFNTLTGAVTRLNQVGVSAAVTFVLVDTVYTSPAETFPITINAFPGASAVNSFTIKPAGPGTRVTGTSTTGVIVLNGADYVTIDGSSAALAAGDLKVNNLSTSSTTAVIWVQTTAGADAATNNTIKNVNAQGSGNTQTLIGIGFGGTSISTTSNGAGNNSNTVMNNLVSKTQYGIYSAGASAANKNTGTVISGNQINAASPNNVTIGGILVRFEDGIQITGNMVGEINRASGSNFGISLGIPASTNLLSVTTGDEVTNATVANNKVASIVSPSTTGYSAAGLTIAPAASGTSTIANNMISGISSAATPSDATVGIYLLDGTGATTRIYFNSVSLTGDRGTATNPSFALAIGGTNATVDIRDNILSNTQTSSAGTPGGTYAIGLAYSTYTTLTSDYNDLYTSGAQGRFAVVGGLTNTPAGDRTSLAAWQTETGKDANSISGDPLFTAANDLHIVNAGVVVSPVANRGTPLAGITTDFDNETGHRTTTPDIGADEFTTYNLVLTIVGNGSVTKTPDLPTYNPGQTVQLTAVAAPSWFFVGWSGDASGNANPLNVIMNSDKNITATFDVNSAAEEVPATTFMDHNFPNPFSDNTTIRFGLAQDSPVQLDVYDVGGRLVKNLMSSSERKGFKTAVWDGRDETGHSVASGIYFMRLTADHRVFKQVVKKIR